MQTWSIEGRNLDAKQVRAYKEGKFDPRTMKYVDTKIEKKEPVLEPEKEAEVVDYLEEENVAENATEEASEGTEEEEVNELEENQKNRERFDELKKMKAWLKPDLKEEYKTLKKELNL